MVFSLIIWSFIGLIKCNDHIIPQNTIRFYVFCGIKYGSAHINRAGTSLPRKGVIFVLFTQAQPFTRIIRLGKINLITGKEWGGLFGARRLCC